MPRPRVAQAKKNLAVLPAAIRLDPPAPNVELEEVWRLTVARRAAAERQLAELPPEAWRMSGLHRIIDQTTSAMIRMQAALNVSRPVVVAQRPAEETGNPWAGFRVVRGGPRKPPDARKVV